MDGLLETSGNLLKEFGEERTKLAAERICDSFRILIEKGFSNPYMYFGTARPGAAAWHRVIENSKIFIKEQVDSKIDTDSTEKLNNVPEFNPSMAKKERA